MWLEANNATFGRGHVGRRHRDGTEWSRDVKVEAK